MKMMLKRIVLAVFLVGISCVVAPAVVMGMAAASSSNARPDHLPDHLMEITEADRAEVFAAVAGNNRACLLDFFERFKGAEKYVLCVSHSQDASLLHRAIRCQSWGCFVQLVRLAVHYRVNERLFLSKDEGGRTPIHLLAAQTAMIALTDYEQHSQLRGVIDFAIKHGEMALGVVDCAGKKPMDIAAERYKKLFKQRKSCSICFEAVEASNDGVVELHKQECPGHFFHKSCIASWFKADNVPDTCPICQRKIDDAERSTILGVAASELPRRPEAPHGPQVHVLDVSGLINDVRHIISTYSYDQIVERLSCEHPEVLRGESPSHLCPWIIAYQTLSNDE